MEIMLIALRLAKGNPSNLILCYLTMDTESDFSSSRVMDICCG